MQSTNNRSHRNYENIIIIYYDDDTDAAEKAISKEKTNS